MEKLAKKKDEAVSIEMPTIKIEVVHAGKEDISQTDLSKPDSRKEDPTNMYKKYADKLEKTGESYTCHVYSAIIFLFPVVFISLSLLIRFCEEANWLVYHTTS